MDDDYWTYAHRREGTYPEHTLRGGKWLLFVNSRNLGFVWNKIKKAVEEGKLGGSAKAARSGRVYPAEISNVKVICVYTYDWTDSQDVKRIREELRNLGITRKISYKTDEDTERAIYSTNSNEKISKYYE